MCTPSSIRYPASRNIARISTDHRHHDHTHQRSVPAPRTLARCTKPAQARVTLHTHNKPPGRAPLLREEAPPSPWPACARAGAPSATPYERHPASPYGRTPPLLRGGTSYSDRAREVKRLAQGKGAFEDGACMCSCYTDQHIETPIPSSLRCGSPGVRYAGPAGPRGVRDAH